VFLNFTPRPHRRSDDRPRHRSHRLRDQKPRGVHQAARGERIKLDRPYTKVPALGIAIAFIKDPWGTNIEMTEGLDTVK